MPMIERETVVSRRPRRPPALMRSLSTPQPDEPARPIHSAKGR
jgi:hypothetical protein